MAETKPKDASGIEGEEPSERESHVLQTLHQGQKAVEVYWNLHKLLWSVRQGGKVVAHVERIALRDCSWVVQPAGNEKARKEQRKNVHAWAKGKVALFPLTQYLDEGQWVCWASVHYSPYRDKSFRYNYAGDGQWHDVKHSEFAFLRTTQEYVDSDERKPYAYAGWIRREHE